MIYFMVVPIVMQCWWKRSSNITSWVSLHGVKDGLSANKSLFFQMVQSLWISNFILKHELLRFRSPEIENGKRFSVCTPEEIEQLRALVETLSWLSKETRCDLAGKTALIQQSFPRPLIRDLINANQIAKEALDFKELGIRVMPIPLDRLHAGVVTDASWRELQGIWIISWDQRHQRLVGGKRTNLGFITMLMRGRQGFIQQPVLMDQTFTSFYQIVILRLEILREAPPSRTCGPLAIASDLCHQHLGPEERLSTSRPRATFLTPRTFMPVTTSWISSSARVARLSSSMTRTCRSPRPSRMSLWRPGKATDWSDEQSTLWALRHRPWSVGWAQFIGTEFSS